MATLVKAPSDPKGVLRLRLVDCLLCASIRWRSDKSMMSQARKCIAMCGGDEVVADTLGPREAVILLDALQRAGLSPLSVATAYRVFRRMLALVGIVTTTWPAAPKPPRKKAREAISEPDFDRLVEWMDASKFQETADLAVLMFNTGLRISIEALGETSLQYVDGDTYGTLTVRGKGGHERVLPVVDNRCRQILNDPLRLDAMRSLPSRTHSRRWNAAVAAVGITSRKPTPHAARHGFATNVYAKSGGNLALVQELLGHSDPQTTARYVTNTMDQKVAAVGAGTLKAEVAK